MTDRMPAVQGNVLKSASKLNNFGFLRLLFASCVVVSHSPVLLDGSSDREPFIRMFHGEGLGTYSVYGFFLISGYLITQSFVATNNPYLFFLKRCARIVPGYFVNFWLGVFLFAPLAGGLIDHRVVVEGLLANVRLLGPDVPGAFANLPIPSINGSVWSIPYEFRCYVLTAILGMLCLHKNNNKLAILFLAVFLALTKETVLTDNNFPGSSILGLAKTSAQLAFSYLVGALFFVYNDRIKISIHIAVVAAIFLFLSLEFNYFPQIVFSIAGGCIIFWVAFKVPVFQISRLNNKLDFSYGLYLYAWPVQSMIIFWFGSISPWTLTAASLVVASLFAVASWLLVEKPALALAAAIARGLRLRAVVASA